MDKVDEVSETVQEVSEKVTIVPKGTYELAPPAFSTKTSIFQYTSYLQTENLLATCSVLLQKIKESDEINGIGKEHEEEIPSPVGGDEEKVDEELGDNEDAVADIKVGNKKMTKENTKEQLDDGEWVAKFFQNRETLLECMDMERKFNKI